MKFCLVLQLTVFVIFTLMTKAEANGSKDANDLEHFRMDIMKQLKELSEKVKQLEIVNFEQNAKIRERDVKIAEQERELKRLSAEVSKFTGADKGENNAVQKDSAIRTMNHLPVKRNVPFRRQNPGQESVAFFAELSSTLSNLSPDHDIHFDKVLTNNGGGYKNSSGTFIVPEAGAYVFMWSITGQGANIPMQLTVNGVVRGRLDPFTGTHDATNTVSGFVVLNINAGDVVLIRTHPTFQPIGQIRSDQWLQSSFGGWKIDGTG